MERGARLKLEDGSVWEIAPKDQPVTMTWLVAQKIEVSRNPDSRYSFRLTNTTKSLAADARLISAR